MAEQLSIDVHSLGRIGRQIDEGCTAVFGIERLSGGASQETWSFVLKLADHERRCILRRASGGTFEHEAAAGMETEAGVIASVARHGVIVPTLLYVLKPEDGLGRGFVTAAVDGETIPRKIQRDSQFDAIRAHLPEQFGGILAAIHAVPLEDLPPLQPAGVQATLAILGDRLARLSAPRPVFALALAWLAGRAPAEVSPCLVHGDYRLGNLIIGPDGVRAVLDWELVHAGDPMEDLAYLCSTPWRFGRINAPVAGLGQRRALFEAYERAGGTPVDVARVQWWEVLASLRWGIQCALTLAMFHDGADGSVERAMIARRSSESEADLMRMIYLGDW